MKSKWQTRKLDDVCNIEYGTRVVRKRDGGSKYPVYGGGGETFAMDEYNRENRVVVARFAMSERCTRFVKGTFFLNDSGLTLSPKNKQIILQEFLDLQILALNDKIYFFARGAAQKNLDVPAFRKMEISYPNSINEQQKLVLKITKLIAETEKLKNLYQQKLSDLEELRKSVLQKEFSQTL